jgi:hypothetical protein
MSEHKKRIIIKHGGDDDCCGDESGLDFDSGCDCGCDCDCEGGHFQRRYQTKAEQAAELEPYLADLKLEVQAVEERLADLAK